MARNLPILVCMAVMFVCSYALMIASDMYKPEPVVIVPTPFIEYRYIEVPAPTPEPTNLTQLEITQMTIKKILAFEEGLRLTPYICSAGYVTIGFGTKLHKRKGMNPANFPLTINEVIATEMLNDDLKEVITGLQRSKWGEVYDGLSQTRKNIMISMAYQLGVAGVVKFKKTWGYLKEGDYNAASIEMLHSKWNRDTPERANRHSIVMQADSMNVYHIYF